MFYNVLIRNRDFVDAVRRVVERYDSAPLPRTEEIVAQAIDGGAPHYYASYETAVRRTRELRHKGRTRLSLGSDRSREMWEEFFVKVERLRAMCPGMEIGVAITRVLAAEPASGFFLSVRQGMALVHDYVRFMMPHLPAGTTVRDTLRMLGSRELRKLDNLYRH